MLGVKERNIYSTPKSQLSWLNVQHFTKIDDYSFYCQVFTNSAGQFAKFHLACCGKFSYFCSILFAKHI